MIYINNYNSVVIANIDCISDIIFDNHTNMYYPVLFLNDYWNYASDNMPVNETTPYVFILVLLLSVKLLYT